MLNNVTTARHKSKSIAAAALPYAAVTLGLYIARNAWVAIILYHVGIVVLLATDDRSALIKAARSGWKPAVTAAASMVAACGGALLYVLWPHVRLAGEPAEIDPHLAPLAAAVR